MNPNTLQLVNTVLAALLIAAILGIIKWVAAKADKTVVEHAISDLRTENAKLEVKLDAALLVVGASITRPELAEKLLAASGRADDKTARMLADIVQLTTDTKANAKATSETEKRLDDLPGRVRSLEENQRKS